MGNYTRNKSTIKNYARGITLIAAGAVLGTAAMYPLYKQRDNNIQQQINVERQKTQEAKASLEAEVENAARKLYLLNTKTLGVLEEIGDLSDHVPAPYSQRIITHSINALKDLDESITTADKYAPYGDPSEQITADNAVAAFKEIEAALALHDDIGKELDAAIDVLQEYKEKQDTKNPPAPTNQLDL